jgi:hypothetical protein
MAGLTVIVIDFQTNLEVLAVKLEKAIDEIAKRGTRAWGELKKTKDFNHWWTVGEALQALQQEAMNEAGIPARSNSKPAGIVYNRAMGELLKKYKFDDMDKGDRSRLLSMMQYRTEIGEWHASLPPTLRTRYTHPTTVWRHWQVSIAPPKPARESKMTNLKQTEEALIGVNEELHQARLYIAELEAARASEAPVLTLGHCLARVRRVVRDAWQEMPAEDRAALFAELRAEFEDLEEKIAAKETA